VMLDPLSSGPSVLR